MEGLFSEFYSMFNKSIDHENYLICFLFIVRTIFWETSMEMDVITVNVIVKNKSTTIFHGLTLIDHRHDIKMFKALQWNHSPVVLGFTWVLNMLASLLWSIRVLLICCFNTNPYCSTPFHFQTKKNNIFSCCWSMYKSWHNYFRLFTNKKIICFFLLSGLVCYRNIRSGS